MVRRGSDPVRGNLAGPRSPRATSTSTPKIVWNEALCSHFRFRLSVAYIASSGGTPPCKQKVPNREAFDASAQATFKTNLINTVGNGVASGDVDLAIEAGSISVTSTIRTSDLDVAR